MIDAARDAELARREAEERRRIAKLCASGEVLQCVVEGGTAKFGKLAKAVRPLSFALVRGEAKSLEAAPVGAYGAKRL